MISEQSARTFCWASAIVGTAVYLVFFGASKDPFHLVYDVAAAPVVFAFIARTLVDLINRRRHGACVARGILLAPIIITFITSRFHIWNVSAHLTSVLCAMVGTMMARRSLPLIAAGVVSAATVGYIRWFMYDAPSHARTWNTLLVVLIALIVAAVAELTVQVRRQSAYERARRSKRPTAPLSSPTAPAPPAGRGSSRPRRARSARR